jgi:putative copper export protein
VITLYSVLLFLHILSAAVWLGGEVAMFGLRALALRSGDRARAVALIRDTDRLNVWVITPAVAVLLGAGFWLVLEGAVGF